MSSGHRIVGQAGRRLVPAYVAAVVLGILGMHALAPHCPAPSQLVTAATTTTEHTVQHAGHHAAAAVAAVAELAARDRVTEPHGGGGAVDDLLMLCAAMVLGAGAALVLLLRRRPSWTARIPVLRRPLWRAPTALAGTGPPASLAFAVIRC